MEQFGVVWMTTDWATGEEEHKQNTHMHRKLFNKWQCNDNKGQRFSTMNTQFSRSLDQIYYFFQKNIQKYYNVSTYQWNVSIWIWMKKDIS